MQKIKINKKGPDIWTNQPHVGSNRLILIGSAQPRLNVQNLIACRAAVRITPFSRATGTPVTRVTATDADDPVYGNSAKLVYSILDGQPYFSVDPNSGEFTFLLVGCFWKLDFDCLVADDVSGVSIPPAVQIKRKYTPF